MLYTSNLSVKKEELQVKCDQKKKKKKKKKKNGTYSRLYMLSYINNEHKNKATHLRPFDRTAYYIRLPYLAIVFGQTELGK